MGKNEENTVKHYPRPIIKNIAFFGDAHVGKEDPVYKNAFDIAKHVAEEGYTIVNGGGPGVMDASTQGAEEAGGETLAVTFDPKDAPGYEGRYVGNVTDKEIITSNYIERMFKLLEHADMFIIFKGGSGTLSEFGTAWVLAKLYYGHHKPFILFGKHWKEIIDVIKKDMLVDKQELSVFEIVTKTEDVLPTIHKFEKRLLSIDHSGDCELCVDKAFMK
ncbi:LOG family protein [Candidatus Woesebacteria bacterium]|nr:LOG family protein [Candidatus Woesebacteria bacterium]